MAILASDNIDRQPFYARCCSNGGGLVSFNTWRPEENGPHTADDIEKCILLICVSDNPADKLWSALVWEMGWRQAIIWSYDKLIQWRMNAASVAPFTNMV